MGPVAPGVCEWLMASAGALADERVAAFVSLALAALSCLIRERRVSAGHPMLNVEEGGRRLPGAPAVSVVAAPAMPVPQSVATAGVVWLLLEFVLRALSPSLAVHFAVDFFVWSSFCAVALVQMVVTSVRERMAFSQFEACVRIVLSEDKASALERLVAANELDPAPGTPFLCEAIILFAEPLAQMASRTHFTALKNIILGSPLPECCGGGELDEGWIGAVLSGPPVGLPVRARKWTCLGSDGYSAAPVQRWVLKGLSRSDEADDERCYWPALAILEALEQAPNARRIARELGDEVSLSWSPGECTRRANDIAVRALS